MADDYRVDGKVAVITGAGGDIGGAAAVLLAERGAAIVAVDVRPETLDALEARMPAGARFEKVVADVSQEDQVRAYAQRAKDVFGRIDLFFNNAGIEGSKTGAWALIPNLSLEDWNQIIGVNMVGAFLGLKYVIPIMMETGGGAIVNTSSINGLKGSRGQVAYVASKHAIDGMTRVAHKEWAPQIRVNSIAPAAIKGRMMTDYMQIVRTNANWPPPPPPPPNGEPPRPMPGGKPLPGMCEPDEIARVAAFLLSDEATYISGQVYSVDGGMIAM
jgi:NAD(P)-dependent dehydrogenase (short-subunit alcohol dehydrogenase family)